jgi:chromate reductase
VKTRLRQRASPTDDVSLRIVLVMFGSLFHQTRGVPPAVSEWRRAIAESDALLIASPEYGHSLPGSLKNGIDWVIGSGELERKVVAITASVPGPDRGRLGLQALRDTLEAVSVTIVGGEPTTRGASFEREVATLLRALVDEAGK